MSGTHEKLPWLFWVQLLLVAIVGVLFILAPSPKKHGENSGSGDPVTIKAVSDNLKPVGEVTTKSAVGAIKKARSGEQVYNDACTACHTAGIANAPKPDDKAAWEPRVEQGLESLLNTAINGKGAMPPRGGNPSVTDDELKAAIIYMTKQAGFDLSSASNSPQQEPVATSNDKDSADSSTNDKEEISPALATPEIEQPPTQATAPVAPTAPTLTEEEIAAVTDTENKSTANEGEKIYKETCFSCHATGIANAPKLDDKAAWETRVAAGKELLYTSAIKGKGAMPPKGGNMSLSDDAIKATVDYMISQTE